MIADGGWMMTVPYTPNPDSLNVRMAQSFMEAYSV
jgi:hypothetical protein